MKKFFLFRSSLILDKFPEATIHSITPISETAEEQIDKKEPQELKEQ